MTNRREVLQGGIALTALPMLGSSVWPPEASAASSPTGPLPFYKIIFDERFAASRSFGQEAARLGAAVHGMNGDITDVWYQDLHPRWQQAPVAIAGMTAHGALFCLERLAWDVGMRVVLRADHWRRDDGSLEHWVQVPESLRSIAAVLRGAGENWGNYAAHVVARCPVDISAARPFFARDATFADEENPENLISWVIAPVKGP